MTRSYLGFTSRGPTIRRNVRTDITGEPLLLIDQDAVTKLELDFADMLEGTETVSSATATPENVTVVIATVTPRVTLTFSAVTSYDLIGKVTMLVTFSSGEKWRGIIRVRRTSRHGDEEIYRDYQ